MQRHFYATKDDLLPVFEKVEQKLRLTYTLMGLFEAVQESTVHSGAAIPTLGQPAPHPNAVNGYSYLVTPAEVQVSVRPIPQRAGGIRYAVDQLDNPISITFTPGGFYTPDILLYGCVGTCSNHPVAMKLYRIFSSVVATNFIRHRAFYVGPVALDLLHHGCRLAIGANSPKDYDLTDEHPTKIEKRKHRISGA